MSVSRNERCPCGSGLKYKHCCAGKRPWYKQSTWTGGIVVLVFALGLLVAGMAFVRSSGDERAAPPGQVWSEEHGHWHDAP